jgi:hypothetical protein
MMGLHTLYTERPRNKNEQFLKGDSNLMRLVSLGTLSFCSRGLIPAVHRSSCGFTGRESFNPFLEQKRAMMRMFIWCEAIRMIGPAGGASS